MAKGEFDKALPRILVYEGGQVDDPQDPGGRTNKGITQGTYAAFLRRKGRPIADVFKISNQDVAEIYKTVFWDRSRADDLPVGVGFAVFDANVNSGVGRAGIWLQQSLGSHFTGVVDGIIGDKTIQAVQDYGDDQRLIAQFCAHRLGTLKRLKTWERFGKGWSARIANVQKIATAWAAASEGPHPVDLLSLQGNRKAVVQDNLQAPFISQVATHVGAGAGVVATTATQTAAQLTPLGDVFHWIPQICAGLTLGAVVSGIFVKWSNDASAAADKGVTTAVVDLTADDDASPVVIDDQEISPAAIPAPEISAPAIPSAVSGVIEISPVGLDGIGRAAGV